MNLKEFKKFVSDNLGNDYIVLNNDFKNTRSKIKMKHTLCNNTYEVIAYNILKEKPTKCPYCYGHKRNDLNLWA